MRLESLIRLIEVADFLSFRELALECLSIKGYQQVSLTDGWSDGGTDVRVFQLPPNPTPIAFQVTVEWDWKKKLREDSTKVREKLKLTHMTLITSRRVPEAEFQSEAEEIWKSRGVRATKLDGQGIASTFFNERRTTRVLTILGIEVPKVDTDLQRPDAHADAAYSFVFFGKETHRFRDATIESGIITVGAKHKAIEREILESEVRDALDLPESQGTRVTSAIDRMIQRGELIGPSSALSLDPKLIDAGHAMYALRDLEWSKLREVVRQFLCEKV
jgi:hypothetical protein